jgi:hypothetical protein
MQMPPGSAMPRGATPRSRRRREYRTIDDDVAEVDADANCMRSGEGSESFRVARDSWISTAHRTASTELPNSASTLSPAVPTMRPPWSAMRLSMSRRWPCSVRSVRSSFSAIRAE